MRTQLCGCKGSADGEKPWRHRDASDDTGKEKGRELQAALCCLSDFIQYSHRLIHILHAEKTTLGNYLHQARHRHVQCKRSVATVWTRE